MIILKSQTLREVVSLQSPSDSSSGDSDCSSGEVCILDDSWGQAPGDGSTMVSVT